VESVLDQKGISFECIVEEDGSVGRYFEIQKKGLINQNKYVPKNTTC
jgi:hypothetical protein